MYVSPDQNLQFFITLMVFHSFLIFEEKGENQDWSKY